MRVNLMFLAMAISIGAVVFFADLPIEMDISLIAIQWLLLLVQGFYNRSVLEKLNREIAACNVEISANIERLLKHIRENTQ